MTKREGQKDRSNPDGRNSEGEVRKRGSGGDLKCGDEGGSGPDEPDGRE